MKVPWQIAQLPLSANVQTTSQPTDSHAIFGHTISPILVHNRYICFEFLQILFI